MITLFKFMNKRTTVLPKHTGLDHLCEFIEDCEHTTLAVRIIHLLGREGPRTRQPSRYIRFVYNRVILEVSAAFALVFLCLYFESIFFFPKEI